MLEKVRSLPAPKREAALRMVFDHRYDTAVPVARRQQFARAVRVVRILSNALWLSLFGGLGVAVLSRNMFGLLVAAALTLLLWPANSIALALCLRRLDWLAAGRRPDASKRWVAFLSPISGVRAADLIARETWADVEPLTVAAALLSTKDLATFARPLLVATEPRSDDALAWWRAENRTRIERILDGKSLRVVDLLAEPARESTHAQRYCPACLAQFSDTSEDLKYCSGERCVEVPLRRFSTEKNP
jgi:hypothetical protein